MTETIFRYGNNEQLADAVFEIATRANDHLLTARSFLNDKFPRQAIPAMLSIVS